MNQTDIQDRHDQIHGFEEHYDYDATFVHDLLEGSPEAHAVFVAAQGLGAHRSALPVDAYFVAAITTMRVEDCGACARLNVKMALEAGVDRALLRMLIEDPEQLPGTLLDVYRHAKRVGAREPATPDDLERVDRLREALGATAFVELATCITGARMYPTMKRALGRLNACEALSSDVLAAH